MNNYYNFGITLYFACDYQFEVCNLSSLFLSSVEKCQFLREFDLHIQYSILILISSVTSLEF